VSVRFSHRGKRRSAGWEFRKGSRQIVPRNRLASELGWWAPDAPAPVVREPGEEGEESEGAVEPAKAKPKRRRARGRKPAAKPKARKRAPSSSKSARASSRKKPAKRGARRPTTRRPASRRKR
jgi:hypothetical protein